jgi:hypothetical protein
MSRLAVDEITITFAGEAIRLRPTLRAAFRLERKYGGFDNLIGKILDDSLTAIADVILESCDRWSGLPDFLKSIDEPHVLHLGIEGLAVAALNHVMRLAGHDQNEVKDSDTPADLRVTWAAYHEHLFEIATGWLGWSPETAWNATAAEIMAAHKGRVAMIGDVLTAMTGGAKDETQSGPIQHSEAEIEASRTWLKGYAQRYGKSQ